MPLVIVPQCDVFKTFKTPIDEYRITISRLVPHGKGEDVSLDEVSGVDKYLSNRGLDRLLAFVERGTTPPKKRKPVDPKKDAPVASKK